MLDLSARQREQVEQLARGRRDAYNFALALDRDCYAADLPPADWADLEPDWEAPGWNEARRMAPWVVNRAKYAAVDVRETVAEDTTCRRASDAKSVRDSPTQARRIVRGCSELHLWRPLRWAGRGATAGLPGDQPMASMNPLSQLTALSRSWITSG